jgi:hypothetical protein
VPGAEAKSEASDLDSARAAVENAIKAAGATEDPAKPLEPVSNLGWQGQLDVQPQSAASPNPAITPPPVANIDVNALPTLGDATPVPLQPPPNEPAPLGSSPADQPLTMPLPPTLNVPPANPVPPTSAPSGSLQAPPPVPPPMMPPGFGGPAQQ